MTTRRHYGQLCGLAAALDVVGERWTLLVVRELLIGPARFRDLVDSLPGVGTNLLSDRLRSLHEHGLVEQGPVTGDSRGKEYRLTPVGEALRGPVLGLARWGLGFLSAEDVETSRSKAAWGFLAVQAMVHSRPVPAGTESYEFRVDDEVFRIEVSGGTAIAGRGGAADPAIVVVTDASTFLQIGSGLLTPSAAMARGTLRIDGDARAVGRCLELMGIPA